ncbi:keratin, type II cytoskeletal 2 epidermal-like [Gigantopelta aegis]|uniref:keratin, type II cytoskeletal 2 epidermal-like n=1 Tax=Gigantopelta aegis TaxID=1735272 RepID=UPI001B88B195|nr:keratin, type II cytoskeletal 2 epidermal-like [Gigantopelta aegis]
MKVTLLVFAAVLFLAEAAVSAIEEHDLVLDVLRNVKRAADRENVRHEIEEIIRHLEILNSYLEGDEELQELAARQLSVTTGTDGSTTVGVNIPLGLGSIGGSFTVDKHHFPSGGSLSGTIGAGVQGSGSIGYDKHNGLGGSLGIGLGADGYGTDAHVGWSQHGGLTTGVGIKAGPVGTSLDHSGSGWSSSFGLSGGGTPSGSSGVHSSGGFLFGKREVE